MRVGLIGAGNIGGAVAALAVGNGHSVVLSNSRGPQTLGDLAGRLGPDASAATAAEAARLADLVVVAIPLKNYRQVPVAETAGKTVIDTNNYYPQRDGHIPGLDSETTTSSELLAAHLPGSHVVKALNTMYHGDLASLPDRRERRGIQAAGSGPDRPVRLRRGGRRRARAGAAVPARHARLRRPPRRQRPARSPG